jgi:hypothetical protein
MTTKSKSRKTAPKTITQDKVLSETPEGKPREVSEISRLVSRFKWLVADQEYQVENATTDEESQRLSLVHDPELNQIAKKLATAEPESFNDICGLLDFALTSIATEAFPTAVQLVLKNVRENIGLVWNSEMRRGREEAEKKKYEELRWSVNAMLEIADRELGRTRKAAA